MAKKNPNRYSLTFSDTKETHIIAMNFLNGISERAKTDFIAGLIAAFVANGGTSIGSLPISPEFTKAPIADMPSSNSKTEAQSSNSFLDEVDRNLGSIDQALASAPNLQEQEKSENSIDPDMMAAMNDLSNM